MENSIIHSDWHVHSEYSYDAEIPLKVIAETVKSQGLKFVGITDHANLNDKKFTSDLIRSANAVKEAQKTYPYMVLGVELTPIAKPRYDYVAIHGSDEGFVQSAESTVYDMELAFTKQQLLDLGVQYAIGASHWRLDVPFTKESTYDLKASIKEWNRQQLWLAQDERVTILGHPWDSIRGLWFEDFSIIPKTMKTELGYALKQYDKCVECNPGFFIRGSKKFSHQYAEYLRELFEMGLPILYGSDAHTEYEDYRPYADEFLSSAGFKDGDISHLPPSKFWLK